MDSAASRGSKEGGILVAIAGGGALFFAPIIGILCDRINRVTALVVGLTMNLIGYGLVYFVVDPTSALMKVAAFIIGFAPRPLDTADPANSGTSSRPARFRVVRVQKCDFAA